MPECSLRTKIHFSSEDVFKWHLRPHVVERFLLPPFKVIRSSPPIDEGSEVEITGKWGIFPVHVVVQHHGLRYPEEFYDLQVKGPFKYWKHLHKAIPIDDKSCFWEDRISFSSIFSKWIKKDIASTLRWRHKRLQNDLELFHRFPFQKKRILISGASGFVGREISSFLQAAGHDVIKLSRRLALSKDAIFWDPEKEHFKLSDFEGFDAFIHLAGENIGSGPWTAEKKDKVFRSRCRDTWLLAKIISRLAHPPKKLIAASAIGFYGNRPHEIGDETSKKGKGFLPDLVSSWEHVSDFLRSTKVVHARFGLILGPQGGVLPKLLTPIRLGIGGVIFGSGSQMQSWISIEDVVGSLYHLLHQDIEGPVVITSPNSVTQKQLVLFLARRYKQNMVWKIPNLFGEMGKELFMASCFASPSRLVETGYHFLEPRLEDLSF